MAVVSKLHVAVQLRLVMTTGDENMNCFVCVQIGSRMGKVFTDKLESGCQMASAVVQSAARALATLWVDITTVPEVSSGGWVLDRSGWVDGGRAC